MLEELKAEVCRANQDLVRHGLVTLTWGNVSGINDDRSLMVIKPSGVAYEELTPDKMVVVDMNGKTIGGNLKPSSDTATHMLLYKEFGAIAGVTHTHSLFATVFAQSRMEIPCLGTTHADHFFGSIPLTRVLTPEETADDYEANTGKVIIERFEDLDPVATPAVLVAGHAPFAWGPSASKSLENAIALEAVAQMAIHSKRLTGDWFPLESWTLEKHHSRKHGPGAYYGQSKN